MSQGGVGLGFVYTWKTDSQGFPHWPSAGIASAVPAWGAGLAQPRVWFGVSPWSRTADERSSPGNLETIREAPKGSQVHQSVLRFPCVSLRGAGGFILKRSTRSHQVRIIWV